MKVSTISNGVVLPANVQEVIVKGVSGRATQESTEILEKPVHLFLFVKVREGWGDDPERYRQMGLEFPKE